MIDTPHYQYLCRLARRLGGKIVPALPEGTLRDMSHDAPLAPFGQHIALDWKRRTIYHASEQVTLWGLIHEMGHCFASDAAPDDPYCEEWKFLGWEIATARRAGCIGVWRAGMKDYMVVPDNGQEYHDFGRLTRGAQNRVMHNALKLARECRLISKSDIPLSCR